MMLKRIIAIALAAGLLLMVAACGGSAPEETTDTPIESPVVTAMPAESSPESDIPATEEPVSEENGQIEFMMAVGPDDADRNRLWVEDLEFFKTEFPKRDLFPFGILSEEEFNTQMDELIADVDELDSYGILVQLQKVLASIKNAHTTFNFSNGSRYPFRFYIFGEDMYIVDADNSLADTLYSKVVKINGIAIDEVLSQLGEYISYENDYWLKLVLQSYVKETVFLFEMGLIPNEIETVFTLEKDGIISDIAVPVFPPEKPVEYYLAKDDEFITGLYSNNYDYQILEDNTLLFRYNSCADQEGLPFLDFNKAMFEEMESKGVTKIILDLRQNTGGNSEVLNPFTVKLTQYAKKYQETKVYILIGRSTFSSGTFALFRTIDAVSNFVTVGEQTGGGLDVYGDHGNFPLPNSQLPMPYARKHFVFSKMFNYQNSGLDKGINGFVPDVEIPPAIEDYINGRDAALEYCLK